MVIYKFRTTVDLLLADFRSRGAKESFAAGVCGHGANIMQRDVQIAMMERLRQHHLAGWFSLHDQGDDRFEICLFEAQHAGQQEGKSVYGP